MEQTRAQILRDGEFNLATFGLQVRPFANRVNLASCKHIEQSRSADGTITLPPKWNWIHSSKISCFLLKVQSESDMTPSRGFFKQELPLETLAITRLDLPKSSVSFILQNHLWTPFVSNSLARALLFCSIIKMQNLCRSHHSKSRHLTSILCSYYFLTFVLLLPQPIPS